MNARIHVSTERGFSLVEALVGMIILALGLLSLASAASLGLAQMTRARQDMQYFADVQQEVDSLVNRGRGKVASGGTTYMTHVASDARSSAPAPPAAAATPPVR